MNFEVSKTRQEPDWKNKQFCPIKAVTLAGAIFIWIIVLISMEALK
jgi:hypothetical protein